jgi:hypothetical protein
MMMPLKGISINIDIFIGESCGKSPRSRLEAWDRLLYGRSSALPRSVRAIPFFSADFVSCVPALTLILIKPDDVNKVDSFREPR